MTLNLSLVGSGSPFAASPHYRTKFTLFSPTGIPKAYYLVEHFPLKLEPGNTQKTVAHSIIIIDRSGSMINDIQALKDTLIKLLTLDEYRHTELLVSLISYASYQDVTCHFQRVAIGEVMAVNSPYIQAIHSIKAGGSTCISQALELARLLVRENELTAISLHSDGYANDPTISTEIQALEEVCNFLKKGQTFLNTISYAQADFKLLDKLANSLSGNCTQTGNIKQVYDALYNTSKVLQESVFHLIEEPLVRAYDYQIFVSPTAQKTVGCAGVLRILGLRLNDSGILYKYRQLTADEYQSLTEVPIQQSDKSVFAFARTHLAQGCLNKAKYALFSTFDRTLIKKHIKAITNSELGALAQDLDEVIFNLQILQEHEFSQENLVTCSISLLEVIQLLEEHQEAILINIDHLKSSYHRRGLKCIPGVWDTDRNLIQPELKSELLDQSKYVRMGCFAINRNTATINLLISRPVRLVRDENGQVISEVAGILLNDLKAYNYYTIVSDGELNLKSLRVKLSYKKVFEALKARGILGEVTEFDFKSEYEINLENFSLLPVHQTWGNPKLNFLKLAEAKILLSLIRACLKEESDTYTSAQVEELKKHYLSKRLYVNFPITSVYEDLEKAVNQGLVDSRVSYKIDVGNSQILSLNKLLSANKFLERVYEVYNKETGEKWEKPTFDQIVEEFAILGHKTISKRMKWTVVDALMKPIFDEFLGLEENGKLAEILTHIQCKIAVKPLLELLRSKWQGKVIDQSVFIELLTLMSKQLENWIEQVYRQQISPIVFYIGATGLFPDEWNVVAQTSEEISAKYEHLSFSKNEQEGSFFEVGEILISVYAQREYFSVQ